MDFEADSFVEHIARDEKKETFGLIICALFHQPKPPQFTAFYHQVLEQLRAKFNDDEKQSVYFYPIAHLHITVAIILNFKYSSPQSPEKCLRHWKECFKKLKQYSTKKSITLTLDSINLSKAAGYFEFRDDDHGIEHLRQLIRDICIPEDGEPSLHIPNIVHTSFMRFIKKPNDPIKFEEKFHLLCEEILGKTNKIYCEIDEVCLAFEDHPYMHIECDEFHVLDIMKC